MIAKLEISQTLMRRIWRRGRIHRLQPSGSDARVFRTTTLLAVLTTLSVFDFALTHSQLARGNFSEANLLAANVIHCPASLAVYKAALFGCGAAIMYRLRRHRLNEVALWILAVSFGGLMVWWHTYLNAVEFCLGDPVVDYSAAAF